MQKPKPFKMRITRAQLLEIAIQSVKVHQNLSDFWKYVSEAQKCGLLNMDNTQIKNWLSTQEDMIYGLGFKREDEANSLSDSVQVHDIIPNRSGMIEIPGTINDLEEAKAAVGITGKPKGDPAAVARSLSLVEDVARRYGWTATGINKDGNPTIFHHWKLDLHVYSYGRPQLRVVGKDGTATPCLEYEQYLQSTPYKGDAVASLLITCIASPDMALHIAKFCPDFLARWDKYQLELKRKIEYCSRDGKPCNMQDRDCGLCTRPHEI